MKTCKTFELAYELNEMGYEYVYIFPPEWVSYDEHASIHSGSGKVIGHYDPKKKLWNFHNDRPLIRDCPRNDNSNGILVTTDYLDLTALVNLEGPKAKEPIHIIENE